MQDLSPAFRVLLDRAHEDLDQKVWEPSLDRMKQISEAIQTNEDAVAFMVLVGRSLPTFSGEIEVADMRDYFLSIGTAASLQKQSDMAEGRDVHSGGPLGRLCWTAFLALFME